nr:RodZ domain-containing protein [Iningainema tapete]
MSSDAQEEQLKEISVLLRQAREEKSLRIEEVAALTHIRPTFLQALDDGRFEVLPEPIYVQGFIRHYGDAVGLDGTTLAKKFATTFPPAELTNDSVEVAAQKPNIYVPLAVPYILLVVAASVGLFYLLNPQRSAESFSQSKSELKVGDKKKASQSASSPKASSKSKPLPSVLATPVAAQLSTPSPTAKESSVEVSLELQDKSWLRVKVDGKTEFEGILNKGDRKTWKAKKELSIRSGNAGAVIVSQNNQQPKQLGAVGSIKEITFTPEKVN